MTVPTVLEYEKAVSSLSKELQKVLIALYRSPNSSATAKQLARDLNYASYHAANSHIGQIGRAISASTGIIPPNYRYKEQPKYFYMVGPYYKDVGWCMWKNLQQAIEKLESVSKIKTAEGAVRMPSEVLMEEEVPLFKEGKLTQVYVNRYERKKEARTACIERYGCSCYACGFDFNESYGDVAEGFIEVHHKVPLATIGKEYEVNVEEDLVPLCSNCHSVIHMKNPPFSIEELKELIHKAKKQHE